jgi:hypothetical protein
LPLFQQRQPRQFLAGQYETCRHLKTPPAVARTLTTTVMESVMAVCPVCNGDTIERCNNPDHGFISALSFHDIGRLGCPCCGHDQQHRMRKWNSATNSYEWLRCEFCDEDGNLKPEMAEQAKEFTGA